MLRVWLEQAWAAVQWGRHGKPVRLIYKCCGLLYDCRWIHTSICIISAPSDPPQSVSGVPTSPTTITLTWQPPSAPNGVISEYRINITEQDTSRSWQLTSQSLVKQITGLHPYYIYSVGMTAVTVGEGPYSSYVEIQTYQDGMNIHVCHLLQLISVKIFFFYSSHCSSNQCHLSS